MTRHLSTTEIASYLHGRLEGAELLRVDDHLDECAACRAGLEGSETIAPGVAALKAAIESDSSPVDHPSHAQIEAYVDGTLDAVNRRHVAAHLEECDVCAEDASDLAEVAATRSIPSRTYRWYAAAAGLAAAAGIAGLLVVNNQTPPPVSTEGSAAAPGSIRIQDGARVVTFDPSGHLAGIPALADADRQAIVAALETGVLPVPAAIAALAGTPGTLMGEARAVSFAPLQPLGTFVASPQPTFEWTPLADATSYQVSVFDVDLNKVAGSPPLDTTRWPLDRPLSRGQTYVWQIRARTRGTEVVAPGPPQPEARFHVLHEAAAARVAAIRERYAGSPLALGVLLAREGLMDDAEREIQSVADANPGSREIGQLLMAVKNRRRR